MFGLKERQVFRNGVSTLLNCIAIQIFLEGVHEKPILYVPPLRKPEKSQDLILAGEISV